MYFCELMNENIEWRVNILFVIVGMVNCSLLSCFSKRNSLLKCGFRISNMIGSRLGIG